MMAPNRGFLYLFSLVYLFAPCVSQFLDITCSSNSDCSPYSVCNASPCEDQLPRCMCQQGWVPDRSLQNCLQVRRLGEVCDSETFCLGMFVICKAGKCSCLHDHEPSGDGRNCRPSGITGSNIRFASLGESCDDRTSACHNVGEEVCADGRCVCRPGLRPIKVEELLLRPHTPQSCVEKDKDIKPLCPGNKHTDL